MIVYEDQLMFRVAEYLQNKIVKIILDNSTEITGQLDSLIRPVRNIHLIALNHSNNTNQCISDLPRIKSHPNPPLILTNSIISLNNSMITFSKIFIRGNHISIMCDNSINSTTKNESEKITSFIIQHPGNIIKNKAFIKCHRLGINN